METVLITNGILRKTLAIARSLGHKGIRVIVGDESRWNPSGFSKYAYKSLAYPSPTRHPEQFLDWVEKTVRQEGCTLFMPTDDDTLSLVVAHQEALRKALPGCIIAVPTLQSYSALSDKSKQLEVVRLSTQRAPWTIELQNLDELEAMTENLVYPVVIKPRVSAGSRGIRIVQSRETLLSQYAEIHKTYELPLIQEYVGMGKRVDVCLLYDQESRLIAHFIQEEVRHFPIDIGTSTVQRSVMVEELLEDAIKIMADLKWTGVAELEFIQDPKDGQFKFMEINTRYWASLFTAIQSGVDFPWLHYQAAIGKPLEPLTRYELGIMGRWLIPGDICHFLLNPRRFSMDPSFFATRKNNLYDDTWDREDPWPVMGTILAIVRHVLDLKMWKMFFFR